MSVPVLLIAFNRPDEMSAVLRGIENQAVARLYVWLDGPRPHNQLDQARCSEVRKIVSTLDFSFPVEIHSNESNLGCRDSVVGAISWFFSKESAGVILEDDCVPSPDFFQFMEQMLDRYQDDHGVMSISGHLRHSDWSSQDDPYHFSKYPHIWGWATWSRVWDKFDPQISAWKALRQTDWLKTEVGLERDAERFWRFKFDQISRGDIQTVWDYQFTFLSFFRGLRNIVPHRNLVQYIGFGPNATHTRREEPEWLVSSTEEMLSIEKLPQPQNDIEKDRQVELEIYRTKRPLIELIPILFRAVYRRLFRRRVVVRNDGVSV